MMVMPVSSAPEKGTNNPFLHKVNQQTLQITKPFLECDET